MNKTQKENPDLNGAVALIGAAGIYAFFNVMIREMSKMYGNQAQVAARFGVALSLLLILHIIRRRLPSIPKEKIKNVVGLGLTAASLVLLITISVNNTKIANSIFLLYAGSILGAFLLGTFVFRESVTKTKLISISLAVIGISLFLFESGAFEIGLIAAFAAGCFDSIGNTLRKSLKGINRNSLLVYQYSIMTTFAIILTFVMGSEIIKEVTSWGIFVTLVYAVLLITIGNLLLYGFQHFDVNIGTVVLASELFFALLFGYIFFNETSTPLELIGGLLIFSASTIAVLSNRTKEKTKT